MTDFKLVKYMLIVLALPLTLAIFSGDRFRYPCQNPDNWDKDFCKLPQCDVTRTCPEHIFKGQRDPRLGPPKDDQPQANATAAPASAPLAQGANCGK
jgi:hypothetical protein